MTLGVGRPSLSADRRIALRRPEGLAAALAAFASVVGLASAQGGYFPSAWGWATFPLLWLAALALALRERVRLAAFRADCSRTAGRPDPLGRCFRRHGRLRPTRASWSHNVAFSSPRSRSRPARCAQPRRSSVWGIAGRHLLDCFLQPCDTPSAGRVGVFEATAVYRLAQPIGY